MFIRTYVFAKSIMKDLEVTTVNFDQLGQLQKIARQTFIETFASENSEANMRQYLEEGFSVAKLTNELQDNNAIFYFASFSGEIVGYLKLNFGPAQTELQDEKALEIERIYVLKQYHGKQVGQKLYEKALQIARERKLDYIWLGVWEKNHRAMSFYQKNGFVEFGQHLFQLGDDEQTDIMMKLKLHD